MTFVLTPGEVHESTVVERVMTQGAVKRAGPGRPRLYPRRVVGDKGYNSRRIRAFLRRRGVRYTIPGAHWAKSNERRRGPFDRSVYRLRNVVERTINRLKQFRRLATRYEKRAENHRVMWVIAATFLLL
ncbi:MAG: Mobile element protein [uncultured Chloroflexia bacterium]|uniref:Mobile element protein n=1 Tax=uncultured Chloroflexia bacterium TaxID=1672391 RepID=A0A6J4N176_9CHLR|nr:MAG: Mobile element protein [uncultured Chloroflexia bacterium]